MGAYDEIVFESTRQLSEIMKVTPAQALKDAVKKAMGRSVRSKDHLFWPAGMLVLGLVEALDADEASDAQAEKAVDNHINLWLSKGGRIRNVDDALFGYSMVRLYERSGNDRYKQIADRIAEFIKEAPKDKAGSIIYNAGKGNANIFADGIGQVSLFLAAHVREKMRADDTSFEKNLDNDIYYYNENNYFSEMGMLYNMLMNYYMYGRDEKSGLIYHGYALTEDVGNGSFVDYTNDSDGIRPANKLPGIRYGADRKGILGWGRAQGWLMMGLSEGACLEKELKAKDKSDRQWASYSLIPWFIEMTKTALEYQRPDGGWSWELPAIDGHIDTSATGMIAYSIAKAYKAGLFEGVGNDENELKAAVRSSLLRARDCMLEHTRDGRVYDALSSCDDFAVHYQTYGAYPWGQGAVLAALEVI